VVGQAQAIAERRFLTVAEPSTPELRAVTRAMNDMVGRLKAIFAEEAARLEALRKKVNLDAVTGLSSREYFLSHLREIISGEQYGSVGSFVMVRLLDLGEINAKLGHRRTDELLKGLGMVLDDSTQGRGGQRAGRLKGGEFAIVCPTVESPAEAAKDIHQRLLKHWLPQWQGEFPDLFHLAAVRYHRDQSVGDLLTRVDEALARAQALGPNGLFVVEEGKSRQAVPAEQWRTLLTEAVKGGQLSLAFFPVVRGSEGAAMHQESVIRLQTDASGTPLTAGDFMPMAANLNLTAVLANLTALSEPVNRRLGLGNPSLQFGHLERPAREVLAHERVKIRRKPRLRKPPLKLDAGKLNRRLLAQRPGLLKLALHRLVVNGGSRGGRSLLLGLHDRLGVPDIVCHSLLLVLRPPGVGDALE